MDNYNISFEKEIYNNETLILYREGLKNIILNCNEESDRVICNIKKNHLLEIILIIFLYVIFIPNQ